MLEHLLLKQPGFGNPCLRKVEDALVKEIAEPKGRVVIQIFG